MHISRSIRAIILHASSTAACGQALGLEFRID